MVFAVVMTCGATAFAEEYNYALASKDFSTSKLSNTEGGVTWTLDAEDLTYFGFESASGARGFQFGSSKNLVKSLTLSTSDIEGTVSSIKVNTSGASKTNATLTVTVGDVQYGEAYSLTTSATEHEFTGSASGEIVLSYSQTSKAAIYIKSITVTYGDGTAVTKKSTKVTFGDEYDGKTIAVKEGDAAPEVHAKVYATDNQETPIDGAVLSYSSSDESVASVDENGKVTLKAFGTATITAEYAGTDEYKASSASYTIYYYKPAGDKDLNVTFDLTKPELYGYGSSAGTSNHDGDLYDGATLTSGMFTITSNSTNSTPNRFFLNKNEITFRVYKNSSLTFSVPENYAITGIEFSNAMNADKVTVDNGTLDGNTWTGNSGSAKFDFSEGYNFTSITLTAVENGTSSVSLSEKEDNRSVISENNGKTVDVTLTRTLDNTAWNTLCLPFSVDAATVTSTFGEGTKLKEYASDDVNSITFKDATSIEAGKPYFIIPGKEKVENPTFTGVTINNKANTTVKGINFDIVGIYSPNVLDANTDLFVGADNKLYRPSGSMTLNGMRVYIKVKNTDVTPSSIMLSFGGDGQTTGISSAVNDNAAKSDGMIYNLNGQAVGKDASKLGKGLYIINGKKVIVK